MCGVFIQSNSRQVEFSRQPVFYMLIKYIEQTDEPLRKRIVRKLQFSPGIKLQRQGIGWPPPAYNFDDVILETNCVDNSH